jgi:hypothetical protein
VTESISQTTEHIQEKLAAITVKDTAPVQEDVAPAVHEPESKPVESTKVETQHKEPLKPTGVLDAFDSFDVTPVIGREFVGVNLAKWLRAPNSDELLRELAITSEYSSQNMFYYLLTLKSLSTWCGVFQKAG